MKGGTTHRKRRVGGWGVERGKDFREEEEGGKERRNTTSQGRFQDLESKGAKTIYLARSPSEPPPDPVSSPRRCWLLSTRRADPHRPSDGPEPGPPAAPPPPFHFFCSSSSRRKRLGNRQKRQVTNRKQFARSVTEGEQFFPKGEKETASFPLRTFLANLKGICILRPSPRLACSITQ